MSADRYAWMDRALCAEIDPDLFSGAAVSNATAVPKRICASCPVRPECAAHETRLREHTWEPLAGIWGGTSQRQRLQQPAAEAA